MTGFPGISPHKVPLYGMADRGPWRMLIEWPYQRVAVGWDVRTGRRVYEYKILLHASVN